MTWMLGHEDAARGDKNDGEDDEDDKGDAAAKGEPSTSDVSRRGRSERSAGGCMFGLERKREINGPREDVGLEK